MLHGINHVLLPVRKLAISDRFYREILGLKPVGERPGMKFYTAGLHHHDLALLETGNGPLLPASGFAHFCLDVGNERSIGAGALSEASPGCPPLHCCHFSAVLWRRCWSKETARPSGSSWVTGEPFCIGLTLRRKPRRIR